MAEWVILEGDPDVEISVHPYDIFSDFIEDFLSSKKKEYFKSYFWIYF